MQKETRDITICFRTTSTMRESLQEVATREKRSLANMIETMLADALETRRGVPARERRRFARHKCKLPALVRKGDLPDAHTGTIFDMSLMGLKLSIPKEAYVEVEEGGDDVYYLHVTFALHEGRTTVTVKCTPEWISQSNGNVDLGCAFADCSFSDYTKLVDYLA